MIGLAVRRLLLIIPSLLGVYTITFVLMHATPGGPWDNLSTLPVPQSVIDQLNARYKLDDPLWKQYLDYLWNVLTRFDFGPSFNQQGRTVNDIIGDFLPVSVQLGAVAMLLALLVGPALGAVAALQRNRFGDYAATLLSLLGVSIPNYVVATLLVIVLAVGLRVVPTGGWDRLWSPNTIIPVIALALRPIALLARYTRSGMLEVLSQDYVRTARAKGLQPHRVTVNHALRNALTPVVTIAGVATAEVLLGSFFVETVTGVPGIGRYFVLSVTARDYPVIMGTTLLFATVITLCNTVVDLLYTALDPRVRLA
jgi:ABC-type dipeptide/oligopeptide/nickel transport system permease component